VRETIEEVVQQVVLDYFNRKSNRIQQVVRKVMILIDDHPVPINDSALEMVNQLAKHYSLTLCIPKNIKNSENSHVKQIELNPDNLAEIKKHMNETDLFILANPQYSNLAKLALSIDDTLGMWMTLQMQLDGKKIVFVKDFIHHTGTKKITSPHSLNNRIQTYIRQLRSENVYFIQGIKLEKWLSSYFEESKPKRHIVLAKHIKEVAEEGKRELIIPENSLITPACKEYAKEMGVVIKQKE
jgi:hypothetical protein